MAQPEKKTVVIDNQEIEIPEIDPAIAEWLVKLDKTDIPAMGEAVERITTLVYEENITASDLARAILQDPGVSTKVLKAANSAFFNPTGFPISTISRAVVLLGFDTVKSICLSVSLIDGLLQGKPRDRLLDEVAQSFHAAYQAEALSKTTGDEAPEEIFVASLLYRIGELAFWSYGGKHADDMEKLLSKTNATPQQLEKKVLGFTLKELTQGLAKEWSLGDQVSTALSADTDDLSKNRYGIIGLSHEIAKASKDGWGKAKTKELIKKLAKILNIEEKVLSKMLQDNADEAVSKIKSYRHAKRLIKFLPVSEDKIEATKHMTAPSGKNDVIDDTSHDEDEHYEEPGKEGLDPEFINSLLDDIITLPETAPDINLCLQMTIEGIHRGLNLDRSLVAIMTPDRSILKTKLISENEKTNIQEMFNFDLSHPTSKLYKFVLKYCNIAWIGHIEAGRLNSLLSKETTRRLRVKEFYIAPIKIGDRAIGVFYADRGIGNEPLDPETFRYFKEFNAICNQALVQITKIKAQKKK